MPPKLRKPNEDQATSASSGSSGDSLASGVHPPRVSDVSNSSNSSPSSVTFTADALQQILAANAQTLSDVIASLPTASI